MYEKEGILVHADVRKAEFGIYQHSNTVEDNSEVFPNVTRIPDVMLRKVDPSNPILVAYLQTINHTFKTSVLLPKGIAGTSKRGKSSKKSPKHEKPKSIPETVKKEVMKPA